MSHYHCNECGELRDKNWHPSIQDPKDPKGLVCDECVVEMEEHRGEFSNAQLREIRKMEGSDVE